MQDKQIAHQQAFIRYSTGQANTIKPFLLEIIKFIDARLAKEGVTIRNRTRLKILESDTRKKLNEIYSEWDVEHLGVMIPQTANLELDFQQKLHAQVDTVRPTNAQALSAAFNNPLLIGAKGGAVDFSKYTKQWKPQEIERVVGVINGGFFAGDTTDQIVRSVNGLKSHRFADGILNTSRANIESMVRTSLNHQAVAARAVYGKENGDIIKGEKIVATLDIRTSAECKDRDGDEVLYVDDKNPARPPFHINCRSSFVYLYDPEFDFLNRGATRASKGAEGGQQVPQKQTYYTWLKNQPAFIQDEALGVQKGLIFRNAGLSPDEFKKVATDRFKKPLTIQQLSQKDKRIAEYLDK